MRALSESALAYLELFMSLLSVCEHGLQVRLVGLQALPKAAFRPLSDLGLLKRSC